MVLVRSPLPFFARLISSPMPCCYTEVVTTGAVHSWRPFTLSGLHARSSLWPCQVGGSNPAETGNCAAKNWPREQGRLAEVNLEWSVGPSDRVQNNMNWCPA